MTVLLKSKRSAGRPLTIGDFKEQSFFIRDFGLGKIDHDPLGCRRLR
jgi:hypothetical protein